MFDVPIGERNQMSTGNSKVASLARACAAPVDDLFYESLLVLAGIVGVIAVGISTGTIDQFYSDLTEYTTGGVTWTEIMRQNPWIWPIGAVLLIYFTASIARLTRRSPRTARLWISAVALTLGFIGGHVYWTSPGL